MIRHCQFSDIVKQRSGSESADLCFRQSQQLACADGIYLRSANMADTDLVSRVDRSRESFHCRKMYSARLADLSRLLPEPCGVHAKGEVTKYRDWDKYDPEFGPEPEERKIG
jgi:hypothetical protein